MSENSFYRAFEDRHRGSRELIKGRLEVYRAFIEPLITAGELTYGVDLGCGRGEWLETLQEMGISSLGIDLDEGMLKACNERGLKVIRGDAIAYLSSLESDSQLVVSAFHVVEHISFDQLQCLVREAHRVLKPGGLLIMETPNPENILVATCSFYLDPTHTRPIPPDLLLFMTDFYHFARSKVLRLQEGVEILQSPSLNLNDVLGGASPDYAVVAQKQARENIQSRCNQAFDMEYGINVSTLATKYSEQQNQRFQLIQATAQQAEAKAQQAEAKAQQAEAKAQQAESTAQQAEAKAGQVDFVIASIYSSYSWRITGPLRWVGSQYRKLKRDGLPSRSKAFIKKVLLHTPGISSALKNPDNHIRKSIISFSRRTGCYSLMRRVFVAIGGRPNSPHSSDIQFTSSFLRSPDDLSLGAQHIYAKLKKVSQVSIKKGGH
jgi:O-antigen chain-terminating methyltransferase